MARHKYRPDLAEHLAELRKKAEAKLQGAPNTTPKLAPELSRLVHELEVHHFELEIQNEELRSARSDNEANLARYTALFDFAPIGYATLSADGIIREINHAGARLLGRERGLIVGKKLDLYVLARDLWTWENLLQFAIESGHSEKAEIELRRVDTPFVARLTVTAIEHLERVVLLALEDITEERKLQRQLATVEQALALLVQDHADQQRQINESLPLLVWGCGPDGACNYLSPQWVAYTGVPDSDQQGTRWLEQVHPDDRERAHAAWKAAVSAAEPLQIGLRLRSDRGEYRCFQLCCSPICDSRGVIVSWYGTALHDEIEDTKHAPEASQHRTQSASVLLETEARYQDEGSL